MSDNKTNADKSNDKTSKDKSASELELAIKEIVELNKKGK